MKGVLLILATLTLSACGHNATVFGKGEGKFMSTSKAEDKNAAMNDALAGANDTCKKRNQISNVISQSTKYEGDLSEDGHKMAKTAKDIIGVFGDAKATHAAHRVGRGNGYIAEVLFKCE